MLVHLCDGMLHSVPKEWGGLLNIHIYKYVFTFFRFIMYESKKYSVKVLKSKGTKQCR